MSIDTQPTDAQSIRLQLREITGRRDLIDEDGTDKGIDFYINAGLRYLDQRLPVNFNLGRYIIQVSSGTFKIDVPNVRAIKRVWMFNETTGARTQLTKKSLSWLRSRFTEDWSDLTTGTPLYYAPNVSRPAPSQVGSVASDFSGYSDIGDITFGDHEASYRASGILLLPPTDGTYTFNIVCAFHSTNFDADTQSFWTVMYPEAVILSTMRSLESLLYRNQEGVKGFTADLLPIIQGIDYDAVEEEMAEVHRVDLVPERLSTR